MCAIRFSLARILILGSSLALIAASARSGDDSWPRFRGPNGSGISPATNLPTRWSEADIRWKTTLPGKGHSSPVIWKDRLFVTSGDETNAERHILCFRASDGGTIWRKQYGSKTFTQNRENSYGTSTPAVDDGGVYVYWTTPDAITVAAITLDGREKWAQQLGAFRGKHGSGASLVVCGGLVWINNDQDGPSALVALETSSGKIRRRIDRRTAMVSYGTPCLFRQEGRPDQLIFASTSHGLTSVNPLDGAIHWESTNLFQARVVSSPIASDGLIICSSGEGGVGRRLVAVRPPAGAAPAAIAYEMKKEIPNVPTPLAKDGRLFILCENGLLRCARTETGEPLWRERLPDRFYASPVWAQNRLYLVGQSGDVFVVATADSYQLLARNPLGEPSFATPAIARNTLFFRTQSRLLAVGSR